MNEWVYGIYFNQRRRRVKGKDTADDEVWTVHMWNPDQRGEFIGKFRWIEIKTDSMLVRTKPETKGWPKGVLVVTGNLINQGDGTAVIVAGKADTV